MQVQWNPPTTGSRTVGEILGTFERIGGPAPSAAERRRRQASLVSNSSFGATKRMFVMTWSKVRSSENSAWLWLDLEAKDRIVASPRLSQGVGACFLITVDDRAILPCITIHPMLDRDRAHIPIDERLAEDLA